MKRERGRPSATTHAAIVEAAFALFREVGFGATTMPQIAERAGIGRATVFRYFSSKADILWYSQTDTTEEFRTNLAAQPAETGLADGAFAERVNFGFVLLFSGLWMLLVYAPVAHWIWGGGLMADGGLFGATGTRDFAGGIVVHETAGLAALLLAVMIGPRKTRTTPPHNPGYVAIGAGLLWVGWFGFNGGSQLAADGGAAMAITVTHLSAASASLSWALWERVKFGRASLIGLVTGTIAGLASITPASGYVGPAAALLIGAIAGVLCQEAVSLIRDRWKLDDTLDVFAVHGVGGIFGTIMIAALGAGTWTAQLGALAIVGTYTLAATFILARLAGLVIPMRVDAESEYNGLDLAAHGERAYDILS